MNKKYQQILSDLHLPDSRQSRSTINGNPKGSVLTHRSAKRQLQKQSHSEPRIQILCLKLRRIITQKIRQDLNIIRYHHQLCIHLPLLCGKIKRNLAAGFVEICVFSYSHPVDKINQSIVGKQSANLFITKLHQLYIRSLSHPFDQIRTQAVRSKRIQIFADKLQQKSQQILDKMFRQCLNTLIIQSKLIAQKHQSIKQICRVSSSMEFSYKKKIFEDLVKFIQFGKIHTQVQQKLKAKQKINIFNSDRNTAVNCEKQQLKNIKNTIDEQSSARHKKKMQYIRTMNKAKQQLKQFTKQQNKLITYAQKTNTALEADYKLIQEQYAVRKRQIQNSRNSVQKISEMYSRLNSDANNVHLNNKKLLKYVDQQDVVKMLNTREYHVYLNTRLKKQVTCYQSRKSRQVSENAEATEEHGQLQGNISLIVRRLLEKQYWKDIDFHNQHQKQHKNEQKNELQNEHPFNGFNNHEN